jgi:uncharacterized membrane protein
MIFAWSFTLQWTPLSIVAGVCMVVAGALLSFLAWKRSGFVRSVGVLEGLRLLVITLVAVTLNQPEWLEQYFPQEQPTLVVLGDASRSMETRDVIDPENPSSPPTSRRESIEPMLKKDVWESLSTKLDVVFERFSSSLVDSAEGTDLNAALSGVLRKHPNLRGVVLLSDGDWNLGDPPARAAGRLRAKNVPVFVVGAGSESRLPDIELTRLDAPTFGVTSKPIRIPFVIESALPRDYKTTVTLKPSSGKVVTKEVLVPAMGRLEDVIVWKPEETGDFTLTMNVPLNERELIRENNERTVPINIREESLKVLLVEGFPRWEYRYLRNALNRDPGVDVSCLLFHPGLSKVGGGQGYIKSFPATLEELAKFDVVFLGDVGLGNDQLTAEQCRLIKGLVKSQAGGLILMPGLRGRHLSLSDTELDELYPVVLDQVQPRGWGSRIPVQFELTETGRRSLLTKLEDGEDANARVWESLPGFQWYSAVVRAKAGTEVLAHHKTDWNKFGRTPLLVTKTFGTGKILFMGTDGAWRWREGVEDKYHYRFWGQVIRWMAYQRSMAQGELMRLFYSPDRPQTDHAVTLNANVMSSSGELLQAGAAIVQIVAPSGKTESVRLMPSGDEWGLFSSAFTPQEHGQYQLTLTCNENQSSLETTLFVQGVSRERLGQPARFDVLEEITSISGGRMSHTDEIRNLLDEIASLPEPEPLVRRLRLWCHPIWAGFLVLTLGIFWTGRKMTGAI